MPTESVFRTLAEIEAVENNVTYAEIIGTQVGTDLRRVLFHFDRRTAFREYLANKQHARTQRRRRQPRNELVNLWHAPF